MKERDITGMRFGRLTAVSRLGYSDSWNLMWICRCDCGNTVRVFKNNLVAGRVRSCGCLRRDLMIERQHGKTTVGLPEQEGKK